MRRTEAAAGAGFWILGSLTNFKGAPKRESANEKLGLAFIGVGGRGHIKTAVELKQNVVAFCDVDDRRAAESYDRCPKAKRFKD